ncbi:MAG: hypothetical protein KIT83_13450 [Bryobacterales bacterium]|nr:hypothetical protein [Bryobacterales bacterium]
MPFQRSGMGEPQKILRGLVVGMVALLCLLPAAAQPAGNALPTGMQRTALNGAPGWTNETIFTGEVVSASLVAAGAGRQGSLELQAQVRVLRPLHGSGAQPGQVMRLRWDFPRQAGMPMPEGGAASQLPTPVHGIFFLDQQGNPLQVRLAGAPAYLGGYLFPLPAETAAAPKEALGGRTPVEGKLAAEVVAAMEFWAAAYGQQLDETAASVRPGGWYPSVVAGHFQQAISLLGELDASPMRETLVRLVQSPSVHLRMAGIEGLLRTGSLDALELLEQDYAVYRKAMRTVKLGQTLRAWNVAANPRSVEVAGRLALHEDLEPFLESSFAEGLAASRIPDALPYLMALLGSPHDSTRAAALRGVCAQTSGKGVHGSGAFRDRGRPPLLAEHVPQNVDSYCPQVIPIRDARAEDEAKRFWQTWWPGAKNAIASDFRRNEQGVIQAFPDVNSPSRWLDQARPTVALVPGGPRVALRQLLYPFRPNSLRGGDPVEMLKRLLDRGAEASQADWTACAHTLREHAEMLQRIDETHATFLRQTYSGPAPGGEQGLSRAQAEQRRAAETERLLDQCLQSMERALSPKGWHDFQAMLEQRAARQQEFRLAAPGTPR